MTYCDPFSDPERGISQWHRYLDVSYVLQKPPVNTPKGSDRSLDMPNHYSLYPGENASRPRQQPKTQFQILPHCLHCFDIGHQSLHMQVLSFAHPPLA